MRIPMDKECRRILAFLGWMQVARPHWFTNRVDALASCIAQGWVVAEATPDATGYTLTLAGMEALSAAGDDECSHQVVS